MNRIKEILKAYKESQNFTDLMTITLINESLDQWEITLKYPENNCVIIRFAFHLIELLPPKATIVFPEEIEYVCFEELGSTKWGKDSDITTLLLSLHNEYKKRARVYTKDVNLMKAEKAQTKWEYVQRAHPEWDFKDVSQLMSELPPENIEQLYSEAKEALLNILPLENIEHINNEEKEALINLNSTTSA